MLPYEQLMGVRLQRGKSQTDCHLHIYSAKYCLCTKYWFLADLNGV